MKRYHLKKKKLKELKEKLEEYSILIPSKGKIEVLETSYQPEIILINGKPLIMMIDHDPFPTLRGALQIQIKSKYVVVDMGAVEYMAKGADVMSPGITKADPNIREGDLVIVVDETHKKPLAVGRSLLSGDEMVEKTEGKAVKTLHHIGDKLWNLEI